MNDERVIVYRIVYRFWGSYIVFEEGDCYKIKCLMVLLGKKFFF